MGDVSPEFEISDLTKPPIAYQDRQSTVAGQNSFSNALKRAVDLREVSRGDDSSKRTAKHAK
jgi:hypothetical protein